MRTRLCLLFICGTVWTLHGAAQQARYRSTTEAVLVDVAVTSGGTPVTGLTARNFELKDMDVKQQIEIVSFADVPISLLLVLDVSSSVTGDRLSQLKDAAGAAVDALRPGDQAALLTIRDRVTLEIGWTSDRTALRRHIDGMVARGWTALHDAVFSAIAFREDAVGRVLILIFSDGADTASWLDARRVIEAARQSDVVITAVSAMQRARPTGGREARDFFGLDANLRRWFERDPTLFPYAFLQAIAGETGGTLLHVSNDKEIASAFENTVAAFKTRYLLTYTPEGVDRPGWHPISVRLVGRRGEVTARRGYWR
ncbi:MAG TPA: VWA domain-containing protein [Vicinamibacterales bacterium]